MRHFEILLEEFDADIRSGKSAHVARRMAQIGMNRVPREWRLPLAKICRRAGVYALGLRLLTRLVNGSHAKPTGAEVTEYSALLIRSGAIEEALEFLGKVNTDEVPEALMIRTFANFARCEYDQAIPDLEDYLKGSLPENSVLVGRSNLALAHVETRHHDLARNLLEENVRLAEKLSYSHLKTYNAGLLAQVHLQQGDFAGARRILSSAGSDASAAQSNNDWSILKLTMIIDGLEKKDTRPFAGLRSLALQKKDWAALRDADLFSLKVEFLQEKFLHLYFGSPLPGFRRCIERELGRVPERHIYVLGTKSAPRFDLETGDVNDEKVMRAGFKSHQLIKVLLRDFYEPLRIGGLHAALNPKEHFEIATSPDRVHQVIRRTRRWLKENKIPVRICEDQGFYSLVIDGNFSFRVPIDQQPKDLLALRLEKLGHAFHERIFSTQELQAELEISESSAHRLLQRALESGKIERLGNAKRPSGYRISKRAA